MGAAGCAFESLGSSQRRTGNRDWRAESAIPSSPPGEHHRSDRSLRAAPFASPYSRHYSGVGALPLRDVCLEKFNPGADRIEPPGPEAGRHLPGRRLFGSSDSRFIKLALADPAWARIHLDSV